MGVWTMGIGHMGPWIWAYGTLDMRYMAREYPWVGPWQYHTGYARVVPLHPGYTAAPVLMSAGSARNQPAQRYRLSVKTSISGSPIYHNVDVSVQHVDVSVQHAS